MDSLIKKTPFQAQEKENSVIATTTISADAVLALQKKVQAVQTQMQELAQERQNLLTKLLHTQEELDELREKYDDQKQYLRNALDRVDNLSVQKNEERSRRRRLKEDLQDLQSICSGQGLSLSDGKKLFDEIHIRLADAADANHELMLIRRRKALDDAEKKQLVHSQISETIAAMPRAGLEARLEASYAKIHKLEIMNDELIKENIKLREKVGFEEVRESDLVETLKMDYPDRSWGRPACSHRNKKEPYMDERMEAVNQRHAAMRKSIMDRLEREHKNEALIRFTAVIPAPPTSESVLQDAAPLHNKRHHENEDDDEEDDSEIVRTSLREDTEDPVSIPTATSSDSVSVSVLDQQSAPSRSMAVTAMKTMNVPSLPSEPSQSSAATNQDQDRDSPPPVHREQKRKWRNNCGGQKGDKDDLRHSKRIKLLLTKKDSIAATQSASRPPNQNCPVPETSACLTENAPVCRIKRIRLVLRENPAASASHSSAAPSQRSLTLSPANASPSSTTKPTPKENQQQAPWKDPCRRIRRSLAQARDHADAMRQ